MKFYLFKPSRSITDMTGINAGQIEETIGAVAESTNTADLVVALYVLSRSSWTGGTAYVRQWLTPNRFNAVRGKWKISQRFTIPRGLPPRFKLIRMLLRGQSQCYPLIERDGYGWEHHYATFQDHLALLFAHELHHFRRHHLGLHPREGEHAANTWAIEQVGNLGLKVESRRLPIRKKRRKRRQINIAELINPLAESRIGQLPALSNSAAWQRMVTNVTLSLKRENPEKLRAIQIPHFERLRKKSTGASLRVAFDPTGKYQNEHVKLIRPLRRNSVRIVVETGDGRQWRWPMAWLEEV